MLCSEPPLLPTSQALSLGPVLCGPLRFEQVLETGQENCEIPESIAVGSLPHTRDLGPLQDLPGDSTDAGAAPRLSLGHLSQWLP